MKKVRLLNSENALKNSPLFSILVELKNSFILINYFCGTETFFLIDEAIPILLVRPLKGKKAFE